MRKEGKENPKKANDFKRERNWVQALHFSDLAATKLKLLKDRRLETVEAISDALMCKSDALNLMFRPKKAMECLKENYTLWAMNQIRNPGSIRAALGVISSCLGIEDYDYAESLARHALFMIDEMTDNFIPTDQQPPFLAKGSRALARAIHGLARTGGILPEEMQKAGEEAIALARKALEIDIRLYGTENLEVANDMRVLADVLDHFNDVDDDEIPRLCEHFIAAYRRECGSSSVNVASGESMLGTVYKKKEQGEHMLLSLQHVDRRSMLSISHPMI